MSCISLAVSPAARPVLSVRPAVEPGHVLAVRPVAPMPVASCAAVAEPPVLSVSTVQRPSVRAYVEPSAVPVVRVYHECANSPAPAAAPAFLSGYFLVPEDDNVYASNAAFVAGLQSLLDASGDALQLPGMSVSGAAVPSVLPSAALPSSGIAFALVRSDIAKVIGYVDGVGTHQPFANGKAQCNAATVTYQSAQYLAYAVAKYSAETVTFVTL